MDSGYLHPRYAEAFADWGRPRELATAGGWLVEREIPGSSARDAMGCYPLFACLAWDRLGDDFDRIGTDLVSCTVVTDPFARVGEAELRVAFPDLVRPWKDHFAVELGRPVGEFAHPHHLRNVRKAGSAVRVHFDEPSAKLLDAWTGLYANLIARHTIRGIAAFSPQSFARQFEVPGLTVEWAEVAGDVAGMVLWYTTGERAYYHLGAYSDVGYSSHCSYAMFSAAIAHFNTAGLRWLGLGAGAGTAGDGTDGLTRFKRGWSTSTLPTYLCGRVFDAERYNALREARGLPDGGYFPAYRAGEYT